MDIFTHVVIGAAGTRPFWETHPLESVAFVLGSVLPDIDVVSRQGGKLSYLRFHQGPTHSLFLHVALTAISSLVLWSADLAIFVPSVLALGAGAMLHALLDLTNTYGVKILWPFEPARFALEWVFFIDVSVIVCSLGSLGLATLFPGAVVAIWAVWISCMALYWALRAWLRRRAAGIAPNSTLSLIPDAVVPWKFLGFGRDDAVGVTFSLDALTGGRTDEQTWQLLDADCRDLHCLSEFSVMSDLSVGYHVVDDDGDRLVCRDLRTRNFDTDFGRLVLRRGSDEQFHVEAFDV